MTLHLERPDRRRLLVAAGAAALAGWLPGCGSTPQPMAFGEGHTPARLGDAALLDDIEARTFRFFWETAHPVTGLVPDRWPAAPTMASVASVGFGLTAYLVGAERGLVTRAQAAERVRRTLDFLAHAPQGEAARGVSGHRGFFYHFLDMASGERFNEQIELSTIDTALLMGGVLAAQSYFTGADAVETRIRQLAETLYTRVDWRWAQVRGGTIAMGWVPGAGFGPFVDYHGYDEAMLLVLLALGSPTHPARDDSWDAFCSTYPRTFGSFMGQVHLGGAPLFWHQYSHVWVDFRGIQDAFMRAHGFDYFENSRRATLAQRAYAISNPGGWKDYGANVWGLTACDGPGSIRTADHSGRVREFHDYRARGAGKADLFDDGTIAPTAAAASLPFAPTEVTAALQAMHQRFGAHIYGRYGFLDAFNTSFVDASAKLSNGRVAPGFGWVDTDYLGIDQGPIVAMIANHRHDLIWRTMRGNAHLRRGLSRAGFAGGWLDAPARPVSPHDRPIAQPA
ncbi:MAG TPA: glucoamylase family protein [Ideonella sp.]|uniref:glucoamylase family protein n=1 Tax=Ideonella sp. TaxID=1929293 RepID=UPI002E341E1E|nr:glucoamylase family protein [Ideonella sp.]HEX5683524.1 glucoamylase family protein [Ideonella sp.]